MRDKKKGSGKILAAVCALIFLGGIGGSIWNLTRSHENSRVEILQDGELLETLDLSREADRSFTVTWKGGNNEIEIKDHRIRVREADCPDRICMDMGWLEAAPIVCLPHHLTIQYVDMERTTGLDGVAK